MLKLTHTLLGTSAARAGTTAAKEGGEEEKGDAVEREGRERRKEKEL